jgi:hypothetical protein
LKLGKSVAQSPTFRKKYKFYPSGQFGFGFLSVFAMSRRVTVDTWTGSDSDEKLKLNLFGPRNYLLVEGGGRQKRGTRIVLELDKPYRFDSLEIELRNLHGFIEFPINLSEGNQLRATIPPRLPPTKHTVYDIQVPGPEQHAYRLNLYPVDIGTIKGSLAVMGRIIGEVEAWDVPLMTCWDACKDFAPVECPSPASLLSDAGIKVQGQSGFGGHSTAQAQLDIRGTGFGERELNGGFRIAADGRRKALIPLWEAVLDSHMQAQQTLAANVDYLKQLAHLFPIETYWRNKSMVRFQKEAAQGICTFDQVMKQGVLRIGTPKAGEFCISVAEWRALPNYLRGLVVKERGVSLDRTGGTFSYVLKSQEARLPRYGGMNRRQGGWSPDEPAFLEIAVVDVTGDPIDGIGAVEKNAHTLTLFLFSGSPLAQWLSDHLRNKRRTHDQSEAIVTAIFDVVVHGKSADRIGAIATKYDLPTPSCDGVVHSLGLPPL